MASPRPCCTNGMQTRVTPQPRQVVGFVQPVDGSGDAFLHGASSSVAATVAYRRARRSKSAPVPAPRAAGNRNSEHRHQHRVVYAQYVDRPERPTYPSANRRRRRDRHGQVGCITPRKDGFHRIVIRAGQGYLRARQCSTELAGIADPAEGQRVAADVLDGRKGLRKLASLRLIQKTANLPRRGDAPRRAFMLAILFEAMLMFRTRGATARTFSQVLENLVQSAPGVRNISN